MISRILIVWVVTSFLFFGMISCRFVGGDKDRNCRSIIPVEKMVDLLHDLYLMEGYILTNHELQIEDTVDYYFAGVFQKHNVKYHAFKDAMDCYLFNRADMDTIHQRIIERISDRESLVMQRGLVQDAASFDTHFREHPDCFVADVCY